MTIRGVFKGASRTTTLAEGDVLFREGEAGAEMFGVISGEIELRSGDSVIQRLVAGDTFGELAIIDSGPRTLTARATQPTEIAVISQRDFLYLVHETPTFALDVMRSMAHLIRALEP